MFSNLVKVVLTLCMLFASRVFADAISAEEVAAQIIAKVTSSPELASYKSARGLDNSGPAIEVVLKKIEPDNNLYERE
jgi:hypothetical protein